MTQEKWQDTLVSIKNKVCTARNAKIAAAFCVVCVVATAGGHYYLHQQHLARHAERVDAMAQMTKAQADQHNISLISEDQACAAAAQAIGKDEAWLREQLETEGISDPADVFLCLWQKNGFFVLKKTAQNPAEMQHGRHQHPAD